MMFDRRLLQWIIYLTNIVTLWNFYGTKYIAAMGPFRYSSVVVVNFVFCLTSIERTLVGVCIRTHYVQLSIMTWLFLLARFGRTRLI